MYWSILFRAIMLCVKVKYRGLTRMGGKREKVFFVVVYMIKIHYAHE